MGKCGSGIILYIIGHHYIIRYHTHSPSWYIRSQLERSSSDGDDSALSVENFSALSGCSLECDLKALREPGAGLKANTRRGSEKSWNAMIAIVSTNSNSTLNLIALLQRGGKTKGLMDP
jgi:hypothetical protein